MEDIKSLTQDDLMYVEGGIGRWLFEEPLITTGAIYIPELPITKLPIPILFR